MLQRALVAVCVVAVGGLALVSIVPELAAAPRKPIIGRATISPKKLPGSGGAVQVEVAVYPRGARLSSVRGRSTLRGLGRSGAATTLQSTGGNTFEGRVNVPANSRTKSVTADIFVEVDSSAGPVSKRLGTIVLDRRDDSLPPPPPPD